MPDLTIEYFWACASFRNFRMKFPSKSNPNHKHVVHVSPDGLACTCNAYKYNKTCTHIAQVIEHGHQCGWHEFLDGGEINVQADGRKLCPRCGGPVISEPWGV